MFKSISAMAAAVLMFFSSLLINVSNPEIAELSKDLVRDGTPKKYFTLSFDDGITQDYKIMEICRKYNFDGITFNINSGLCGESWDWVAEAVNMPGLTHK